MRLKYLPALVTAALCLFPSVVFSADNDLRIRPPILDTDGRFWVYRNGLAHPPMPFSPYGWMSDVSNVLDVIKLDLSSADNPNRIMRPASASERDACIRVQITWGDATWASVAFISGPDNPPWWGDNKNGKYYNLAGLTKKKLVLYARGDKGGESFKVQVGVLGDKPYGDSLHKPVISEDIVLTTDWTRYEIDLKDVPAKELEHICNGFGFTVVRDNQSGSPDNTVFYLDDIYYE